MHTRASIKKLFYALSLAVVTVVISGCFALPVEPPVLPPPTITVPEPREFETVQVSVGDIRLEDSPFALYLPSRIEGLRFRQSDVPIEGIFVAIGDEVAQGDLVASLYMPEIQTELDALDRRLARIELELTLVDERIELAQRLAYEAGREPDTARLIADRSDLLADREITLGLHEHVFALNESRHLRATMDGIITSVLIFTEGMLSSAITNVAVISDQDISAFVVQGRAAEDMHPGDRFEMTLGNEIFTMVVVDPDDFGFVRDEFAGAGIAQAFLAFAGAMPSPGFETSGRVHIPLDEVSDALFIPASAVRRYGERTFVYVLNDGLREVRDVQAGLEADGIVEIVHGLSEGEHVIL